MSDRGWARAWVVDDDSDDKVAARVAEAIREKGCPECGMFMDEVGDGPAGLGEFECVKCGCVVYVMREKDLDVPEDAAPWPCEEEDDDEARLG